MEAMNGRYGHIALPAFGNTLLVHGGYRGNVLKDFIAYTTSVNIAKSPVSDKRFLKINFRTSLILKICYLL